MRADQFLEDDILDNNVDPTAYKFDTNEKASYALVGIK